MTTETQRPHGIHRMAYRANAAILAVIVIAIVVFLNYFFAQFNYRKDLTTGGVNALAPSTKAMLKMMDEKSKGNFTIANLFGTKPKASKAATDQDKKDEEQARTVADLLREFQRSTGKISVVVPPSREDIEKMIRDRFAEENAKYEAALKDIETFAAELQKFATTEAANFSTLAQRAEAAGERIEEDASDLRGFFKDEIPKKLEAASRAIAETRMETSPRWDRLKTAISGTLTDLSMKFAAIEVLGSRVDASRVKGEVAKQIFAHFKEIVPEVKKFREKIDSYTLKLDELPPSKLAEIVLPANDPCLVILPPEGGPSAQDIKVITRSQLFTAPGRPTGADDTSVFQGEEKIFAAMFPLVQTQRKNVVLISPFAEMSSNLTDVRERLERLNFAVSTWSPPDPMAAMRNPEGAPPPKDKPDFSGEGVIYVVIAPGMGLSPAPQARMMEQMATPALGAVLETHVKAGGDLLLLVHGGADAFPPEAPATAPDATSDTQPKPVRKFVYADLLESFGVRVNPEYVAVSTAEHEARTGARTNYTYGLVTTKEYPDTAITRPLQSLRSGFGVPGTGGDSMERGLLTALVEPVASGGDGKGGSLVTIPAESETFNFRAESTEQLWLRGTTWAADKSPVIVTDGPDPKKPGPKPPLSIAAYGQRSLKGKPQRIVVFGTPLFVFDRIVGAVEPVTVNGRTVFNALLPANGELFTNSVLWLAGYENMIAVSSKAGIAGRIGNIETRTLRTIQWGLLWVGLPAAALIAGATIFAIRRRG